MIRVAVDWLERRAVATGHRLALRAGDERLTFADLDRRVRSAAGELAQRGIGRADRVMLVAGAGVETVVATHAIPRAGAVVAPVSTRLTATEMAALVEEIEPAAIVHDTARGEICATVGGSPVVLGLEELTRAQTDVELDAAGPAARTGEICGPEKIHSMLLTSGTTGRPKGAMLTWSNHVFSAWGSALRLGVHPDDGWLACMPLHHAGGLAMLMRSVVCGIPVVLHERFDPDRVSESLANGEATIVSVVGTMLRRLLERARGRPAPPSLRCVLVGGGPVSDDLLEQCLEAGWPVIQTYGLTEAASQVTTQTPNRVTVGSCGPPLYPTEVRIAGAAGPGDVGEILVRGPTVMVGYHHRRDDTAAALDGGWLHTGDVGWLDQHGELHVTGRRDDVVLSGGENVYPAEVEAALCRHPMVVDACVVGLVDPEWGQRVVAAVVCADAWPGEHELIRSCRNRLAGFKVPTRVRRVPALPRTSSGKLLRRQVRDSWHD